MIVPKGVDGMTLGARIFHYRTKLRLSQEQLAEKIGVSRQAVSKWEQDAAQPEIDKLISLAQTFSVSTDVLLGLKTEDDEHSDSLVNDNLQVLIRFLRKLWHNIGFFLLIWGAAITALSICVSIIWRQMEAIFIQVIFLTGIISFICGLVLVIFRIRRKTDDLS
jgi:transcriptional regulator with XRE-family HTH domain